MSDVTKVVQMVVKTGVVPTRTGSLSLSDTYQMLNNGNLFIEVVNGDASPTTVTIVSQNTVDGLAVADRTVVVSAGTEQIIGPFPPQIYNNSVGEIEVTFSNITAITLAALNLG